MGPPLDSGGEVGHTRSLTEVRQLQLGHRLIAVERLSAFGTRLTLSLLQWGHRLIAVESGVGPPGASGHLMLQWGHRLIAVESRQWGPIFSAR